MQANNILLFAWHTLYTNTGFYRSECAKILQASVIRAVNASYFTFVVPVVMFLVFTFNTFFGKDLTTSAVFSTLSHLYYLNLSLILFVKAVIDISECQVGLRRISVSRVTAYSIQVHVVMSFNLYRLVGIFFVQWWSEVMMVGLCSLQYSNLIPVSAEVCTCTGIFPNCWVTSVPANTQKQLTPVHIFTVYLYVHWT